MLPENEVKAIYGTVTVNDVKPFMGLAGACGWNTDPANIANAAVVGSIIDRLEAYERDPDFENWGFESDYMDKSAEAHLGDYHKALWAAFRCGYVQALKDRD